MSIKRQVRADKGEAARDFDFIAMLKGMDTALVLGEALSFAICRTWKQRIRGAEVIFRNMSHVGRLLSIDSARAGQEEFFYSALGSKIQHATGASNNRIEHFVRRFFVELCAGLSGRVDDVIELAFWKWERADISLDKSEVGTGSQMRSFASKGDWITRQNRSPHTKRKLVIDMSKTFQQPHAKKARASGDKKRFPAGFRP